MPIITAVSSCVIYTATALSSMIIGIAIAADNPDNFVSQHPDAATWIMGTLAFFLAGLVAMQWRRLLNDHKEMKTDFSAAQNLLVSEMKQIADDIHGVCIRQARLEQHCEDVCGLKERE